MDLNHLLKLKEDLLQIHGNTALMQSKMRVSDYSNCIVSTNFPWYPNYLIVFNLDI